MMRERWNKEQILEKEYMCAMQCDKSIIVNRQTSIVNAKCARNVSREKLNLSAMQFIAQFEITVPCSTVV